ncbi:hypothetical protein E2542_SST10690 [Spatholobus suberectus]|nr:hypothetical protein E2542_SST10690 [Spatholobus suberectus]
MDGLQIALPIVGVVAAAAVTFYAVSFAELREVSISNTNHASTTMPSLYQPRVKFQVLICNIILTQKSFRDLEESEYEDGVYRPSPSSRERRARRQANKNKKS